MAAILTDLGVVRTWRECRAKIKNLKADYRKSLEKKTPFRYFDQMKSIMSTEGERPSSGPTTPKSSSSGNMTIDSFFVRRPSHTQESGGSAKESEDVEESASHEFLESSQCTTQPSSSVESTTSSTTTGAREILTPQHLQSHHDPLSVSSYRTEWHPSDHDERSHSPHPSEYYRSPHEDHSQSWRYFEEPEHIRGYPSRPSSQQQREDISLTDNRDDYDSSSRSSMIITHVVSNVIEPVTQVVMPSATVASPFGAASRRIPSPAEELEIIQGSPPQQPTTTLPPIRLEFVLEDENIILQPPHSSPIPVNVPETNTTTVSSFAHEAPDTSETVIDPPPTSLLVPQSPPKSPPSSLIQQSPAKSPPSILKRRLKTHKPSTITPKPTTTTPSNISPSRRPRSSGVPVRSIPVQSSTRLEGHKRRKMLDAINQKTVETLSDLLTETSQNLLRELHDAEQRFILWEEEKRGEERKREEVMFSKLIAAMKSSASTKNTRSSPVNMDHPLAAASPSEDTDRSIVTNFTNLSKRINEMVCGEVKETEESVRQWETKMQRQESRHTEKLFAMIINAIKTPCEAPGE